MKNIKKVQYGRLISAVQPGQNCNNSVAIHQVSTKRKVFAGISTAVVSLALSATALAQSGRNYVYIVGSSTVYPFATVVAERDESARK